MAPVTWYRHGLAAKVFVVASVVALTLSLHLVVGSRPSLASDQQDTAVPVVGLQGYNITLFARGTQQWFGPDSIVVAGEHVYIDYQNKTAKDCADAATASSTIVQYSADGRVERHWAIPGHSDGMRLNRTTHLLWATVCEDGNPALYTVNPNVADGDIQKYSLAAPHGGGYDDIAFIGTKAYLAASNPPDPNTFPAVVSVQLNADHTTTLTAVLMGNAAAHDAVNNKDVVLNEVDPDSMTVDPSGRLVLVNQGGSELVLIANPGTATQTVTSIPVGTQLDDTVWATSQKGRLFVTDGTQNATYIVRASFTVGTVYTETPNDSGVAGLLATINLATGQLNPVAIGFGKPTGLIFVSDATAGEDSGSNEAGDS